MQGEAQSEKVKIKKQPLSKAKSSKVKVEKAPKQEEKKEPERLVLEIGSVKLEEEIARTVKRKLNGFKGPEKEMLQTAKGPLVFFLAQLKIYMGPSFETFINLEELDQEFADILQNKKFKLAVADLQRRVTVVANPDFNLGESLANASPVVLRSKEAF